MKRIFIISICIIGLLMVLISVFFALKHDAHRSGGEDDGYHQEIKRFERVIADAPDEELLLMLRFAIYRHYVPTWDIDPYHSIGAGVGAWHRTKRIYSTLKERNRYDLLSQICPDKELFNEYVYSKGVFLAREERDTTVMDERTKKMYVKWRKLYSTREIMMRNLAPDSALFKSMADDLSPTGLRKKYFGTPLYNKYKNLPTN